MALNSIRVMPDKVSGTDIFLSARISSAITCDYTMKRGFLNNKKAQKTALNPSCPSSKNDVKSSVGPVAVKLPYGKMENTGSFPSYKRKQTKKEFNPARSAAHKLHSH